MAPVPQSFTTLLKRSLHSKVLSNPSHYLSSASSQLFNRRHALLANGLHALYRRADDDDDKKKDKGWSPGQGAADVSKINNRGFFALFAILGAAMVVVGIWFFFWAKNGGCVFRKNDWDDYKSTVLRRKGPDGKTLSNATKSTRLGGKTMLSSFAAGYSDVSTAESYGDYDGSEHRKSVHEVGRGSKAAKQEQKQRKKEEQRQQKRQQQQKQQHHKLPTFPKHVDDDVREYRHEKSARVGGLNRRHDGSHFDYTNTDRSDAFTEDSSAAPLVKNVSPNVTPKKDQKKGEKKGFLEKRREKKRMEENKKKSKAANEMRQVNPGPSILKDSSPQLQRDSTPHRSRPSAAYSFRQGDDSPSARNNRSGGDYYHQYRDPERYSNSPSNPSTQDSYYNTYRPRAQQPSYRQSPRSSQPSSRQSSPQKYGQRSEDVESDAGTKAYRHHIPGLSHSEVGVEDSVSQVGARKTRHGYRRGGTGRRDSLSESD